jgi:hypothetical protein
MSTFANTPKSFTSHAEVDFIFSDASDFFFSDGSDFVFQELQTETPWTTTAKHVASWESVIDTKQSTAWTNTLKSS